MIINLKKIKEYIDTALDRKADKVHTHPQYLTDHQDISGKEDKTNKSNSISSDTGSTTKYPTIKAVEDYAQPKGNYSVTVTKLSNATTGYIATYEVKQGNVSLGKIDIPKDYLIKSGSTKSVTTANNPVNGYAVGDKYIDFIVNTKDSSGTDEHIYINVKDLIDTYEPVTISSNGLMTAEDKIKLNGIAEEANKYVHPSGTAKTGNPDGNKTPGFGDTFTVTQFTSNNTGHISGATDRTVKIPNTEATTSKAGLMSANDKTKLNGVATGATNNTVENVLTSDSTTNALSAKQGKELKAQIDGIVAGTIATDHNHDSRYYTEYEVDTKLNGKAASVHTHDYDEIDVTDVQTNIDYNNYKTQGLYKIWWDHQQNNTNRPSTSGGLLKVEEIPNGYAQTFYCYGANNNQVFYRTYYHPSTTWNGWIRIDGQDKANSSHTHPDTQITWNGSALAGSVSPIDMAMYEEFSANRLAYLPGGNITVEYSINAGSTWNDYGATTEQKTALVTTAQTFIAGKGATANKNNQLRITINAGGGNNVASNVYLDTRKLMIYFSTAGGTGTKVKIETSTYGTSTTWSTVGTYNIAGYSGWNSYPLAIRFGGMANQTTGTRIQNIRLTFTTESAHNFNVSQIKLFGENCWLKPSNLANNGHMYIYNENQDVTFPAKIIKSGGTSSQLLLANGDTKATGDFATSGHTHTTSNITNFPTSMTPTAHATNSTTYGGGTSSNYGHVKVSDNYTSSAGNASQSVAASSAAVKSVYDVANGKTVTLTKLDTATSGYIATYEIKQGTTSLGKIDIPKDFLVKSGSVKSVTTANSPVSGYVVGDKYIDFIINTKDNSGTDDHVYINVKDLIDTYTAGTGLNLSSNAFSVKYGTAAGTACQGNDSRLSDSRVPKFTDIGASSSNEKDLNTYRTGGFYYIGSDANSKYIDHCPLPKANNVSFFLLVETWGASNNNYVKQTLTYYTTNKTYTRTKTGNSDANTNWNPWKLISTSTEYIVGTQTTSTNIWTGKANDISSLQSGQVIYYKLPYASTNADVTLNLTLADGTTTGAKNVWFWNGSRVRQQYGVNSIIGLIYNGSEWWVINPSSNNNNNSLLYGGVRAKAGSTAIAANTLIGAKKDGLYYKLTSGMVLDIKYPIVYATGAIAANAISTAIYHTHWNASTSNNGFTSWTVPNMIYLEGDSYSKGQFKISSTIMTQTPTNGKYYIALGEAETANQIKLRTLNMRVYHYEDDEFVPVTDKTEYGGRNLLSETQAFTSGTNGALTGDAYKGCAVRRYNNTSGTTYVDCSWSNMPAIGDFNAGDFFTLSFWAKGTGSVICYSYGNSGYMTTKPVNASDGAVYSGYGDGNCTFTLTEDWKRYFVTWKFNGTSTATNVNKILLIRTTKGSDSYIAGPKFERGNIAHDWSPNPDDKVNTTDSRLTNARTPTSHTNTGNNATYGQASTSVWGHTKLNSATNSSDETTAATPKAVKAAYDLANGKAASNHVHGWINNDGTLGGANDKSKAVITNSDGKITTGTIDTSRISDGAVTNTKVANETLDMKKLAVHVYGGTSGTAGYVKLLRFNITGSYQDRPIQFKIERRHATEVLNCFVTFKGVSSTDPDLGSFVCSNEIGFSDNLWNAELYLYKEDTSTWSLIVRKSENYDSVILRELLNPAGGITVTKIQEFITSLPTNSSTNPLKEIVCLNTMTEYIEGTHGTAKTGTWTGVATKIPRLTKGTHIYFKMTSPGNGNATLNLTLPNGYSTGAKEVWYNATTRFTTHLPQNTVLNLVYDGSKWINIAIQNTNNFERLYANGQVVNGESSQLPAGVLICGKTDQKYYKVANEITFNVRYPIFMLNAALNSGATTNNVYHFAYWVNLQTTLSEISLTTNKMTYIEGTAFSNGNFTISSTVFRTEDTITSANGCTGKFYYPIGMSYSTKEIRFDGAVRHDVYYFDGTNLKPVEDYKYQVAGSYAAASHTHSYIPSNADGTTTGNLTATTSGKGIITANQFKVNGKTSGNNIGVMKSDGTVDTSTYVKTSSTVGYIKNDGTIGTPTNTTYSAEKGITLSSGKFGHSNTAITAQTTSALKKIKYDAYGHITGTDDVAASDLPSHTHSYVATSAIKNDLTTGGASNVLSAEQGKTLNTNKLAKNADDTSTGYITAKGFKVSGKSNFLKADGTTADANNYSHPTNYTTYSSDLYKITVNNNGHVSAASKVTIDSSPNSSNTNNLVTSKGVADALAQKAALGHTHINGWRSIVSTNGNAAIWVNDDIQMAEVYFLKNNATIKTGSTTLDTNVFSSDYLPWDSVYSATYYPDITLTITNAGNVISRNAGNQVTVDIAGHFTYRYGF